MKHNLTLIVIHMITGIWCSIAFCQTMILKLDASSGVFKNIDRLPAQKPFIVEGEIEGEVLFVEMEIKRKGRGRTDFYIWNRTFADKGSSFEIVVNESLLSNSEYDLKLVTYKELSLENKNVILKNLIQKVYSYIDAHITIERNRLTIQNPKEVSRNLNYLLLEAMCLQKSRNGVYFKALSGLFEKEVERHNGTRIQYKRRFSREQENSTSEMRKKTVEYLVRLVYDEVLPFYESELVQVYRQYNILGMKTEREKFTLPINAGVYGYTTSSTLNKIATGNSGVVPGVGITLPITRDYSVNGKKIPSVGVSFGVLTTPIRDSKGIVYSTPVINVPIYGAIGVVFLHVVRLNAGVLFVAPHKTGAISELHFYPTMGLTFELEGWLGLKR